MQTKHEKTALIPHLLALEVMLLWSKDDILERERIYTKSILKQL